MIIFPKEVALYYVTGCGKTVEKLGAGKEPFYRRLTTVEKLSFLPAKKG